METKQFRKPIMGNPDQKPKNSGAGYLAAFMGFAMVAAFIVMVYIVVWYDPKSTAEKEEIQERTDQCAALTDQNSCVGVCEWTTANKCQVSRCGQILDGVECAADEACKYEDGICSTKPPPNPNEPDEDTNQGVEQTNNTLLIVIIVILVVAFGFGLYYLYIKGNGSIQRGFTGVTQGEGELTGMNELMDSGEDIAELSRLTDLYESAATPKEKESIRKQYFETFKKLPVRARQFLAFPRTMFRQMRAGVGETKVTEEVSETVGKEAKVREK